MSAGLFVTLEGGEGAGKSTLIHGLGRLFSQTHGRDVVLTREPGGSPGAEAIRAVLMNSALGEFDAMTQALLFAAARRDHMRATIRPALAAGKLVFCDRFIDSTRAYQGAAGALPAPVIRRLETLAVGRSRPRLTLILDLPAEVGLARAAARHGAALATSDRFEAQSPAFHEKVRAAFLRIAREEPTRCRVLDATQPPEALLAEAEAAVLGAGRRG